MPLNAWNATADINAVINFVNQQASGGAPIAPEDFYSLQLLDTIRLDAEHYVYFKQADTMPIQNKADKLVLRRWAALQAHTVPLTEGVPPVSDKGSVKKYEMEAYQYGRYMEFTDKVDFKVVDPVVAHYTKEYSLVAMETLDLLAREALMTVAQKYYASAGETPVTAATGLTVQSIPKMNELRKIILCMKKALIKPRSNGKYLVIGTPEFYFDLFSDPLVQSWMTINQSTGNMYDKVSQPLPDMFDMSFIETMAAPVSGEFYDSDGNLQMRTQSLELPILLGYHLVKQGPYGLSLMVGPKVKYNYKLDYHMAIDDREVRFVNNDTPFGVNIVSGMGVSIGRLFFDFVYEFGLNQTEASFKQLYSSSPESSFEIQINKRTNVMSMSIGMLF